MRHNSLKEAQFKANLWQYLITSTTLGCDRRAKLGSPSNKVPPAIELCKLFFLKTTKGVFTAEVFGSVETSSGVFFLIAKVLSG